MALPPLRLPEATTALLASASSMATLPVGLEPATWTVNDAGWSTIEGLGPLSTRVVVGVSVMLPLTPRSFDDPCETYQVALAPVPP